jgi:hypothetical protein
MPVADLDLSPEELPVICAECGESIRDEVCMEDEGYLHTACCEGIEEEHRKEAEEFAKANCKITRKLHRFDESKAWACSPEDYEMGARESYTENSVRARNRHNCTNYEQLIPDRLDDSMWARARYEAIRVRVEELLDKAADDQYEDEEEPKPDEAGD